MVNPFTLDFLLCLAEKW